MNSVSEMQTISVCDLVVNEKIRSREGYSPSYLEELVKSYKKNKNVPPPLSVFYDGEKYILSDGFYRLKALQEIGNIERVSVKIFKGGISKAVEFGCIENNIKRNPNVFKRTNKCKAKTIMIWLRYVSKDKKISSQKLAELVGISGPTVTRIRNNIASKERKTKIKFGGSNESNVFKSKMRKKRSLVPIEIKKAIGVLKREVELKKDKQWNARIKQDILESICSVHDWINEEL